MLSDWDTGPWIIDPFTREILLLLDVSSRLIIFLHSDVTTVMEIKEIASLCAPGFEKAFAPVVEKFSRYSLRSKMIFRVSDPNETRSNLLITFTGVGRIRTQDVERRQGFTRPNHRSRRFFASASEKGFQKEKAAAKREKVSGWPVNLTGRSTAFAMRERRKNSGWKARKITFNPLFLLQARCSNLSHSTNWFWRDDVKNLLIIRCKIDTCLKMLSFSPALFCLLINFDTSPLYSLIPLTAVARCIFNAKSHYA